MLKKTKLTTSLCAIVAFISPTVMNADTVKIVKVPIEQKIVEIHMTQKDPSVREEKKKQRKGEFVPLDSKATCSGEFIGNEGEILTAKHCVAGFDSLEVQTYDHRLYIATVVATSAVHDLAIIHIDRTDTAFFTLARTVERGERVFVLGSPLGITSTLSIGVVARDDGDDILLDCSVLPGNSGGPVFNEAGNLVGVVTAVYIEMAGVTHLGMAQSLDAVRFFIYEVAQRYSSGRK